MKNPFWITIIGLISILFLWRECSRPDHQAPETDTVTVEVLIPGDSVPYPVEVEKPVPVFRDTGSTRWRDRPIDTMAVLEDYFARYYYSDTITDDTSFLAIIQDTITQNKIAWRGFQMQNLRPKKVLYQTINHYYNNKGVYIGGGIGRNPKEFGLTANLMFLNGKNAYSLNYDIMNRDVYFSLYLKIWSIKKRKPP